MSKSAFRSKSTFGFDEPEDSPGFLLWQTTITWQRLIKKALDEYNISHAQFVILAIMLWFDGASESLSQNSIIRQSKLDKMTVSKSLKKLAETGLVKRAEYENDTRAKSVTLTKKGREMAAKLVPIVEGIDEKFFGVMKKQEQKILISHLYSLVVGNSNKMD